MAELTDSIESSRLHAGLAKDALVDLRRVREDRGALLRLWREATDNGWGVIFGTNGVGLTVVAANAEAKSIFGGDLIGLKATDLMYREADILAHQAAIAGKPSEPRRLTGWTPRLGKDQQTGAPIDLDMMVCYYPAAGHAEAEYVAIVRERSDE